MVYHDGLKDLDFVDITVIGYLRQVGCTGGGGCRSRCDITG